MHLEVIKEMMPNGARQPQLMRQIPGFVNNRITKDFKAGTFMMPLESKVVSTYSSVHDVARSTLLVFGESLSSHNADSAPASMLLIESIRTAFASRRLMKLACELYSTHSSPEYDRDDGLPRQMELLVVKLTTLLRELR